MTYEDIIEKVSDASNLSKEVVDRIYKSYWEFIRNTIKDLPLKKDLSEEQFNEFRTSFNTPSIGKLYCSYDKYSKMKKRFNNIKNIREKFNENKKD
jgi:hypothetical protein